MSPSVFLLLNLALAFDNAGTIRAHEADIVRSWKLIPAEAFHRVQASHGASFAIGPFLTRILSTHWARTLLINTYGFILLASAIRSVARP
jgi:hypothetical protein